MNAKRVACVGIFVADVLAKPIDRMPERGRLVLFDQLELHSGGCANNTAIALARLGVPTVAVGKVGTDAFGDFILRRLEESGVSTRGMSRSRTHTSLTFVAVDSTGERTFFHTLGANGELELGDIPDWLWEQADHLHVGGTFLMPRLDGSPTARLLQAARSKGLSTSLDTTWDAQGRWLELLKESLPHLDYFMPSYEEAAAMTGLEKPEAIVAALREYGPRVVVLKMGARGSYLCAEGQTLRLPALSVPVVDTTGAGDAYAGGFLAGIALGYDLEAAARLGTAAGAACVMAIGTTAGLRDLQATWELWNRYEPRPLD
ncbi:MAG: PfkB family kinase [Candidatus Poribacteria bacterium]|nr:MAG: PfkB family kinase [Candidatus Poribacteria bacterium]